MDLGISGKKAIICASSRGLGKACAHDLAKEGAEIVINGVNEENLKKTEEEFLKKGIKNVIITLGEKGCYFANKKENFFIKAFKFKDPVIDTTGAGDAFNGAFAVALSKDLGIKEALTFANKVAGISTTKQGAAASMPSLEDLKNY